LLTRRDIETRRVRKLAGIRGDPQHARETRSAKVETPPRRESLEPAGRRADVAEGVILR
jgi:hypothetical protein